MGEINRLSQVEQVANLTIQVTQYLVMFRSDLKGFSAFVLREIFGDDRGDAALGSSQITEE